jgi:taurine dioxygenase
MTTTMHRPVVGPRALRRTGGAAPSREYRRFELRPEGVTLGATVVGLDLRASFDDDVFDELSAAWSEWKVLVFRDQHLTVEQHARFASRFGRLTDDHLVMKTYDDPADNVVVFARDANTVGLENGWHSDGTFRPMPTAGTTLRAIEVPPVGGDTVFADMAAALDTLPDDIRARLAGLTAWHDWSLGAYATKYEDGLDDLRATHPPVEHPVVVRHPRTRRPTLFVNPMFTRNIDGLPLDEATELLDVLCRQVDAPELQYRLRWQPGTIALWDNIAVQHYGVNDYYPARRVMARATFFDETFEQLEAWDGKPD